MKPRYSKPLTLCGDPLSRLLVIAFSSVICLTGCGKSDETAKTQSDAPKPSWREWIAKGTDAEWWKKQWSQASDSARKAKASLETIRVDEVKKQAAEITKAIERQDFSKVEAIAGELGKHLSVEKLGEGLRFITIQRQKGGEAAAKAIDEYAARQDLNEFEKAAAQNLKKSLMFAQREDVQGSVVWAILFACECKFGSHEGAMIGGLIVSILFPDLRPADAPSK